MKNKERKNKKESIQDNWIHEFENLYILSYQPLCRHAKLIFHQEDNVKELLILTYTEAYQRRGQLLKEKDPVIWLLKRSDVLAESKMNATKEMLEASYAEERMQSKEAKKENWTKLDETSVLLEIEEKLGIDEEQEVSDSRGIAHTTIKGIFSFILLVIAVMVIFWGGMKIREKLEDIDQSEIQSIDGVANGNYEGEMNQPDKKEQNTICIQVGAEAVYLSDIGQVLYTLPLEESNLTYDSKDNPEIQKQAGWTYYLPCPERENTQLQDVSSALHHTLYRMKGDGKEIEIVAEEVDNYTFWNDDIYISQFDRVRRIDADQIFEKRSPGIFIKEKDDELFLYDDLGRTLDTDPDGSVTIEDRVFKMSSNRVLDVVPATRSKGETSYYIRETEDGDAIFSSRNGREELFEQNGKNIDSFCIVGDWIYYSTCVRMKRSGSNYSELYRKSLVRDEEAEMLGNRFIGRIYQMYYSKSNRRIYGDYVPKSWKNNHGVIAVISLAGDISYLNDEELRADTETTGNDWLRFVMIQDGNVYCYWEDCLWEKNERPSKAIWRKVLVIPDDDRILLEE